MKLYRGWQTFVYRVVFQGFLTGVCVLNCHLSMSVRGFSSPIVPTGLSAYRHCCFVANAAG